MSRILVEVHVPAAGICHDVMIPYEMRTGEILQLLRSALATEAVQFVAMTPDMVLCDYDTGAIYNVNWTPEEIGLGDGTRMMLI